MPPASTPQQAVRLPWLASITGAFVVTLVTPASWAFGLAGFLAGGGLVVVTWPILVLPTPTGLQNSLGGPVSSLVFGAPSSALLLLIGVSIGAAVVLLAAGLLAGAWAEREGIAIALDAAEGEGILVAPDLRAAPGAGRIALLRLLSLAPVAIAALLAWRPVYDVTYRELTLPQDLVTPLPVRVLTQVPAIVAAVALTWLVADAAAAVGVRRLVLERRPVLVAWLLGWVDLVRRPHRILPTALVGDVATVLLAGPGLIAAALGWGRVREVLLAARDPLTVAGAILIWVAIWLAALVLVGVAAAFRTAAWTLEVPRPSSDAA